ncbi:MAG: single-stranded-DNA-specific exonuclease RecJ [Ktedonobacterales bacterium]|nr:single-stranded-DNA-specific exonuclease RecJ [Ktedonobacterales bacterium]
MRDDPQRPPTQATPRPPGDAARDALAALEATREPWRLADELPPTVLRAVPGRTPLQVQILHNRDIQGAEAIEAFLAADGRSTGAAAILPGLPDALARLQRAIAARERVTVFGDYDTDGMTSCAILLLALRALGADAHPYIPRRDDDGRGLNPEAVRELANTGTTLLVTTDCGTANVAETELARTLGMDVIVTDHHPPHGALPAATAIVNPALAGDLAGESADLSGAGVAFRVAEALLSSPDQAERLASLLDLVAIGTIGDIVPLTRQNWALARAGLRRLRQAPRPGLRALLARTGLASGDITERDISFALAPRLNAAARLGEPMAALHLLVTDDPVEAARLADQLDALNARRQVQLEAMLVEARAQARAQMAARHDLPSILVVIGEDWPLGIIGLVASRLADEYNRPAFAISRNARECRGSGRGPQGSHLGAALARHAELFLRFGGHERAAGFTIATEHLETVLAYLRADDAAVGVPPPAAGTAEARDLLVDCRLTLSRLTLETYAAVRALAPYGPGFPEPVFICQRVRLARCWRSGIEGRTLRLALRDDSGVERVALWSRHGDLCDQLRAALPALPAFDVLLTLGAYQPRTGAGQELTPRIRMLIPTPN